MEITNNKRAYRFEIYTDDNDIAYLEYRWLKGNMVIMKTLVPAASRGKGFAAALVRHAFATAGSNNYKIISYCPFATHYIEKHNELLPLMGS